MLFCFKIELVEQKEDRQNQRESQKRPPKGGVVSKKHLAGHGEPRTVVDKPDIEDKDGKKEN